MSWAPATADITWEQFASERNPIMTSKYASHYTLEGDGSVTFHGEPTPELREKAYAEARKAADERLIEGGLMEREKAVLSAGRQRGTEVGDE